MSELSIKLNRTINAPVEKVFNAWLNAETLSQFMLPMRDMPNPRTESNAQVGGEFVIYMNVNGEEIPHRGKYLEINRFDKLVFTWESPYSPEDSTVTINFNQLSENQTEVEFSHVKFLNEEARDDHENGWGLILETLDSLVSSQTNQAIA